MIIEVNVYKGLFKINKNDWHENFFRFSLILDHSSTHKIEVKISRITIYDVKYLFQFKK